YPVAASSVYGYTLVSTSPELVNDLTPIVVGTIPVHDVYFYYVPLSPAELTKHAGVVLKQTTPRPSGRIGTDLLSTISLSNSDVSGDGYDLPPGSKIEIYYDPARVDRNSIRVSIANTYYTVDNSQDGKLVLNLHNGFAVGDDIEATIIWNLKFGPTEEGVGVPLYAQVIIPDTDAPDGYTPVAVANEVSLYGTYYRPSLIKYANGSSLNYHYINFGPTNPDGSFISDDLKSITYTYRLANVERNLEQVILTDYLPEYEMIDEQGNISTATAVFDPTKNPGWTLMGPGVVSYTQPVNNSMSASLPQLILDFPDIVSNQSIQNTASFVATPYNMASTESEFTGRDSIISLIGSAEPRPKGMFDKTALRPRFYDYPEEKALSFRWRLTVSGYHEVIDEISGTTQAALLPEGHSLGNIKLADDLLDIRMRYVGVDVADFGPARVVAYDASRNIIYDAYNQRGEVIFPLSIRDDIDRIEILDSPLVIRSGKSAQAFIITELRDPTITISDFSADPTAPRDVGLLFPNTGHFTVDRIDENGIPVATISGSDTDVTRFLPFDAGLGISKRIVGYSPSRIYLAGDAVSYDLTLNLYNAGSLVSSSQSIPQDSVVVENVVIYDVIPRDFIVDGTNPFTPSNALRLYSTGLRWSIIPEAFQDADGWHDVLKIEADTLSPFLLARYSMNANIGTLRGSISELAFHEQRLLNHVYLDFDEDEFVYAGRTTVSNPYLDYDDNPFEDEVLWDYAPLDIVATKIFSMQKEIRKYNPSTSSYDFWSRTGIKTPAGEKFQYRLRLRNNTDVVDPRTNVVVVDVFPYIGDVGIARTDQHRFSQFENTIDGSGAIKVYLNGVELMGGYTLQYLLDPLPDNYWTFDNTQVSAYLDNPLHWSSSYSDASAVKGIRVDLGSIEVFPGDEVEIRIDMVANNDLTNVNLRAYNSFVRKDNVQTSYIEAPRVYNEIPDKPAEIRLRKRDSATTTWLNGAVFGLYLVDGSPSGQLVQIQTTAATATPGFGANLTGGGWIVFTGIERGNYYIQEITPPPGYEPDTTRYPVYYADFVNPNPSNHNVPYVSNKYSNTAITGQPIGIPAGTPILNTLLPYYGSIKIHKTDGSGTGVFDGDSLEGIGFTVRQNVAPNTTYTAYTDADGIIRFNNLPVAAQSGVYTVTEIAAPGRLTVVAPFTVTLNRNGTVTLQSPLPAGAAGRVQLSGAGDDIQIDIANNIASVRVRKIGVDEASMITDLRPTSGIGLGNVALELFKVNPDGTETAVQTQTTATSGSELGWVTFANLEVNQRYGIREVAAPPDFITVDTPYYFVVDELGQVNDESDEPYWNNTIVVVNEREEKLGKLVVSKFDANDESKGLPGAVFTIERWVEGTEGGEWVFYDELTSDSNGYAQRTDIPYGAYRVVEIKAPGGYIKQPQMTPFFIARFTETIRIVDFVNTELDINLLKGLFVQTYNLLIPSQVEAMALALDHLQNDLSLPVHTITNNNGTVTVVVGLADAVFEMKEYAGSSVDPSDLLGTYTLTSDSDGMLQFAPADAGFLFSDDNTYTFQEITAPAEYKLNTTIYTWRPQGEAERLIASGGIKWLSFENYPETHRIVLTKYVLDTDELLPDASFKLYYPYGDAVFWDEGVERVFTTDGDGRLEMEGLAPGTYYLREVESPVGYLLPEGYWKIVILGDPAISERPHNTDDIIDDGENEIYETFTSEGDVFLRIDNETEEAMRKFDFPATGGKGIVAFIIAAAILFGLSRIFSALARKQSSALLMLLVLSCSLVLAGLPLAGADIILDPNAQGTLSIHKFLLDDLGDAGMANDGHPIADLPEGAIP
ncbi:MAG: SpaA isopeptide-forming pilin-related protein, partial [Actinomycetia bacterium]|nr:SpaA isopeptide-forming pilin-related protein [Actinomycetes bacterium]